MSVMELLCHTYISKWGHSSFVSAVIQHSKEVVSHGNSKEKVPLIQPCQAPNVWYRRKFPIGKVVLNTPLALFLRKLVVWQVLLHHVTSLVRKSRKLETTSSKRVDCLKISDTLPISSTVMSGSTTGNASALTQVCGASTVKIALDSQNRTVVYTWRLVHFSLDLLPTMTGVSTLFSSSSSSCIYRAV